MKALDVAVKSLREQVRQPRTFAVTLGLPVVFMLIFGFAFGDADTNETYALAVVNHDESDLGERYVDGLRALEHADGTPVLDVTMLASPDAAREGLERRELDGLLVLPADFTEGLTPTAEEGAGPPVVTQPRPAPPRGTHVNLTGDAGFPDHAAVRAVVDAYTRAFAEAASGRAPAVAVATEDVTSRELTQFDRMAPGLMVFAILVNVPAVASYLAREVESGTLDRVRQSPTRAASILGGATLAQMAVAVVGMALMLASATLLGFRSQGSLALAYGIALAAALAAVGLGMVVAALVRTQQEANNLGILVAVPGSLLSGAFFDLPPVTLFTWGGHAVGPYDLIPTTHAVNAMRAVLTFGRDFDSVAGDVAALVVLATLALLAGVALYGRQRFAAD